MVCGREKVTVAAVVAAVVVEWVNGFVKGEFIYRGEKGGERGGGEGGLDFEKLEAEVDYYNIKFWIKFNLIMLSLA